MYKVIYICMYIVDNGIIKSEIVIKIHYSC